MGYDAARNEDALKHDWLLEVLSDIRAYAISEKCIWVLPHIEAAYDAARNELLPQSDAEADSMTCLPIIGEDFCVTAAQPRQCQIVWFNQGRRRRSKP